MKKLWITYAWKDNKDGDIDFIAQELRKKGIDVRMDKWEIKAGERLWEQIDKFIADSNESDGWAIVATQNSLGSESCKEEIAYALDRALKTRGSNFPLIGIFPSTVEDSLISAAIKTRLYVSIAHDNDWAERILAALEGRKPSIERSEFSPYHFAIHRFQEGFALEMRPRAGTWSPFFCAIPISEKEQVAPKFFKGAKGVVPTFGALFGVFDGTMGENSWWFWACNEEATPSMSYYLICKKPPSKISFGKYNSDEHYSLSFSNDVF